MSGASPAAGPPGPNGQRPAPPPGAHPVRRAPKSAGNPLRPIKRKGPARPPPVAPKSSKPAAGAKSGPSKPKETQKGDPPRPNFEATRRQNDGWSIPKPEGANDFPLTITKKSMKEGFRFHVMKLVPPQRFTRPDDPGIDPTNQNEFTRPVTLHRRDPRQPPPGREVKEEPPEPVPENEEEAQKLAQAKAEREAQRAIDDAQKAPVMRDPNAGKKLPNKKQEKRPATQVHYQARTEEQKRQSEIRYEEALPWHLEDVDGKNVWVGQYEAPLSMQKVALQIDGAGFRMVPLEKWYKFSSKRGAIQTMSVEEAERTMGKKAPVGRWAMREQQREAKEKMMAESRQIMYGPTSIKQESASFRQAASGEKMDHDDIDFSGDEFQDDDETAGYEPDRDEDAVESKDRVRREMLGANLFGEADEKQIEKDEAKRKREEEERKLFGKNLKKALKRRDKQHQYASDDSENRDPFASSSSESDSESEEKKDEDEKKDEKGEKGEKGDKDKAAASGTSSKGTTTPQGKKEASKKGKSLKRPGSPVMSDSSGTESTRAKKKKKTGPSTSVQGSRGGTPLPRRPGGAGSGSDGEATAGEMSDGAGGKKARPMMGSAGAKGSPMGSRAGSPAPPQPNTANGSRAGSPAAAAGSSSDWINPPTEAEIIAALPARPQGILIKDLLAQFPGRIEKQGCMPRSVWLQMVRKVADFSKTDKLLRRKA